MPQKGQNLLSDGTKLLHLGQGVSFLGASILFPQNEQKVLSYGTKLLQLVHLILLIFYSFLQSVFVPHLLQNLPPSMILLPHFLQKHICALELFLEVNETVCSCLPSVEL